MYGPAATPTPEIRALTPQEEIRAQLTGPGGPFEIVEEEVLGTRLPVF